MTTGGSLRDGLSVGGGSGDEPAIDRLVAIMAALRTPGSGCPWDLEQTFATIVPYTIEEAYEVADAVARGDLDELREELGDLLLQVVFHARMAEEAGAFGFEDVAEAINAKLIRRHPHVFGDKAGLDADGVKVLWDEVKRTEAAGKRGSTTDGPARALDGVASALPALMRADKLSRKAAKVGFDWTERADVVAKVREELSEVEEALEGDDARAVAEEIGDLLFSVANLARHAGVDPETALRDANRKFEGRFAGMEDLIRESGREVSGTPLADLEEAWVTVKRRTTRA